MNKVGVRKAQVNLTTLIKNLPFAITRYGVVVAVVKSPEAHTEVKTPEMKPSPSILETQAVVEATIPQPPAFTTNRCEAPNTRCPNEAEGLFKLLIYDPDRGEVRKEVKLCIMHYKKAKAEGVEVEEIVL